MPPARRSKQRVSYTADPYKDLVAGSDDDENDHTGILELANGNSSADEDFKPEPKTKSTINMISARRGRGQAYSGAVPRQGTIDEDDNPNDDEDDEDEDEEDEEEEEEEEEEEASDEEEELSEEYESSGLEELKGRKKKRIRSGLGCGSSNINARNLTGRGSSIIVGSVDRTGNEEEPDRAGHSASDNDSTFGTNSDNDTENDEDDEVISSTDENNGGEERHFRHPYDDQEARLTRRAGIPPKSNSKRERIEAIYGTDREALQAGIDARNKWIMDAALPNRKSLGYSRFFKDDELEPLVFGNGIQKVEWLEMANEEILKTYLPNADQAKVRCAIGPNDGVKIIGFDIFSVCDVGKIYEGRNAYIFNAGGQIKGLDWASGHIDGYQYVAVSTKSPDLPTPPELQDVPPAYRRNPHPSSIQIWRIPPASTESGSIGGKPSLALLLCHEWGEARSLKWCNIPHLKSSPDEIGYLGAIFSDGNVRVIRVTAQSPDGDTGESTASCRIIQPLFEGHIEDALCTCLTWLNKTDIAVGCSNGFIAVWDLRHYLTPQNGPDCIPPFHYIRVHQTFVLDIEACVPSYPDIVLTSSMDGYCRITTLSDPGADSMFTGRSRLSSNQVAWVDNIHTAIASEEGTWVKMYPLRRFYSSTSVAKQSQGGVVLSLAGSLCHPCVMVGGGEGEAVVFNPLRRTFHGKIKVYQLTWFKFDYSEKGNLYRFFEGFKMENIQFKYDVGGKEEGLSTVFEEKAGVTRVAWNPNPRYGGWAAAGTAGGLVRVEDLSMDV